MSKIKIEDPFACSFCGKSSQEVDVLVIGPCVNICDECVEVAVHAIADIRNNRATNNSAENNHPQTVALPNSSK